MDLNRAVHIAGGDSVAGTLRLALHLSRDQVLVNEDPLSCGPAPATDNLKVWRSVREDYLSDIYLEWPDFSFGEYADNGLLMNAERLRQEQAIVAWAGIGLQDQLLLAWVIFLFDRLNLDLAKLAIVQFENAPSTQDVISAGELGPQTIREHRPAPHRLDSEQAEELRRLWKVYTSDDPAALSSFLGGSDRLSIVRRATRELLLRYPDIRSGLGIWDERLLNYTSDSGLAAARVVGDAMVSPSLDWQGDAYLFHRLAGMASARSPLVSLTGDSTTMRGCAVKRTRFGQDVSVGKVNNVKVNGIDDWIGGVHLSDKSDVTFRSGDSLILS